MLYISILLLILAFYRFRKKIFVRKSEIQKLIEMPLYNFITNLECLIKKEPKLYKFSSIEENKSHIIMYRYSNKIDNFITYFKKLEYHLLEDCTLAQINTWDLKMCVKVLSFINDGLRPSHHSKWANERIKKNDSQNLENDIKQIQSDSFDPVKILSHPEVIGIVFLYLRKVGERANSILDEMYNISLSNRDIDIMMHAHFIKAYIDCNFINPLDRYSFHEILYSSQFQFDLFLLKGSQIEDEHIRDPYLDFVIRGKLNDYIY